MADTEKIPRCSQCAFVNPDDAKCCGMCGDELGNAYPDYSKNAGTKTSYEKSINGGDLFDAVTYARVVWGRELFRLFGICVLGVGIGWFLAGRTEIEDPFTLRGLAWGLLDLVVLAFLLGASGRLFLDCIRCRRTELMRGIAAGFQNIVPMTLVALLLLFFMAADSYIVYLWLASLSWLGSNESMLSEELSSVLILSLVISGLFLFVIPAYIWLMAWIPFATSRVLDRKSNQWTASLWAIGRLIPYFMRLLKIGYGQIWGQIIGLAMAVVGVLAVFPLTGLTFTAIYEWVRLNETEPDEY